METEIAIFILSLNDLSILPQVSIVAFSLLALLMV